MYAKDEWNSLANLAFISAETNKFIGSKPPVQYMGQIDPNRLREQWIPENEALRDIAGFPQFLDARRHLLVDVLNQMLGLPPFRPGLAQRDQDETPDDEADLYAGPEPGDD
ncbi:hypothetical protein ACRYCC_34885 [Actinomadura scrupuli]